MSQSTNPASAPCVLCKDITQVLGIPSGVALEDIEAQVMCLGCQNKLGKMIAVVPVTVPENHTGGVTPAQLSEFRNKEMGFSWVSEADAIAFYREMSGGSQPEAEAIMAKNRVLTVTVPVYLRLTRGV